MEQEEKIRQLQLIEQNLQNMLVQKQSFQIQLMELESALNEIEGVKEAFKIVGNIMISTKKAELSKDLGERKETTELRIKSIEKQENELRTRASALQKDVLKEMKK